MTPVKDITINTLGEGPQRFALVLKPMELNMFRPVVKPREIETLVLQLDSCKTEIFGISERTEGAG